MYYNLEGQGVAGTPVESYSLVYLAACLAMISPMTMPLFMFVFYKLIIGIIAKTKKVKTENYEEDPDFEPEENTEEKSKSSKKKD